MLKAGQVTIAALNALGPFLAGLMIGLLAGLLLGPIFRYWLAWREWARASREADLEAVLADRILERLMDEPSDTSDDSAPRRRESATGVTQKSAQPSP